MRVINRKPIRWLFIRVITFSFLCSGPVGSGSLLAADAMRPAQTQEASDLDRLISEIQLSPPETAGLEEKPTPEDAEKILSDPHHGYSGWEQLGADQRQHQITQYVDPVNGFDVTYPQFQEMTALLSAASSFKGPLGKTYKVSAEKPGPFPKMRPQSPEEIKRGKLIVPKTVFLLGAGGAGSRLFKDVDDLFLARDSFLPRLTDWEKLSPSDRQALIDQINPFYKEILNKKEEITSANYQAALVEINRWAETEQSRLLKDLSLSHPDRLRDLKNRMDEGLLTKPTFPLEEGGLSPLAIWLKVIASMDPQAMVVMGVSAMTDQQILAYLIEAYKGQHGSSQGTYFGLQGPIGFVIDAVVPVTDSRTEKLALDPETGELSRGGTGGAGSLEALGRRVKFLEPGSDRLVESSSTGFEWFHQQGKENLFIADADTVGVETEAVSNLIYSSLGLMERHDAKAVAFAYPYPEAGSYGCLVNVIMDEGVPGLERRILINREAKEIDTVTGLVEAIKEARKKGDIIPANAGLYLVALDALQPLVEKGFPWHLVPRPPLQRYEKYKPDIPELLAAANSKPFYFPILEVPEGVLTSIKNTRLVGQANKRRYTFSFWPETRPLALDHTKIVIPYSAFAGRGDAAHLVKLIDALNARGVVPTVVLLDEGEGAQAAQEKLKVVESDYPGLQYTMVDEKFLKPISQRPVILEIFTVISDELRARAHRHVELVAKQNQSGQRPLVLAIHAPPSREIWTSDSSVADTVNLFMELPAQGQPLQAGSLYSGYLYDRVLEAVTADLKTSSREDFRNALLNDLDQEIPLTRKLADNGFNLNAFRDSFWVFRYTSILGNPREQRVLIEAMKRLNRPVVIFTFYDPVNDNKPDYSKKYGERYAGHTPLVDQLFAQAGVNLLDLSGHYSVKTKVQPGAKVTVVNLPSLIRPRAFTRLMGASDQTDVTGMYTLLESLGFVFHGVGPIPFYLPTQDIYETLLTQPLTQMGNQQEMLKLIETLYRPVRGPVNEEEFEAAVNTRVRLTTDPRIQSLYQKTLSFIVTAVPQRFKQPALINHFNLLTDTLEAIDTGSSLVEIVQLNRAAGLEEVSVADENLASELKDLLARETAKGIFPKPPLPSDRFDLPQIGAQVLYYAGRGVTHQPPEIPADLQVGICCVLDEKRLRYRGEEGFRWRDWNVHGGMPIVEGQATFVAVKHEVRPMDEAKLRDMVDLARLLPGYRIQDNYSRQTEDGRIIHMGRSVPVHDHLNAVPMTFPAEELSLSLWKIAAEVEGAVMKRSVGYFSRIRLIEGTDPEKVIAACLREVQLLDEAIRRIPNQVQGYNTSVVFKDGKVQVYLIPRRVFVNPQLQPVNAKGDLMNLTEYLEQPESKRVEQIYIGLSTPDMLGDLLTRSEEEYLRLKQYPDETARRIAALADSVSTPEETLRSLDAIFQAGLEERQPSNSEAEFGVGIPWAPSLAAATPTVEQLTQRGGISENPIVLSGNQYIRQPNVQAALAEGNGIVRLTPDLAKQFLPAAKGGVLIAEGAQLPADQLVIMDSDLSNAGLEEKLAVIKPGFTSEAVFKALSRLGARFGDLTILETEPELTPSMVGRRMLESLGYAAVPRTVIGTKAEVEGTPALFFQFIARHPRRPDFPDVVVLSVTIRLTDEQGRTYNLSLWA